MASLTITATATDSQGHVGTGSATVTIGPVPLFAEQFEGVPSGQAASTGNTGFASLAGSIIGTGAAPDRGVHLANAPALTRADTPLWTASVKVLATQELTLAALPDASVRISGVRAAGVTTGAVGLNPAGALQLFDANTGVGTSTGVLAAGRYRIEHFADSTGDTQTVRATRAADGVVVAEVSGAYSGPAADAHRFGFYTAANISGDLWSSTVTDGSDWIPSSPPPAALAVRVGASSNRPSDGDPRTSTRNLETALRAATGDPRQHIWIRHTYNGDTFPATLAQTLAANDPVDGYRASLVNVKFPWGQAASGALTSRVAGFCNSIPAGYKVKLIGNHEPQNDPNALANAAAWCADQARMAADVAALNDPRLDYVICDMVTIWDDPGFNGGTEVWSQPILDNPLMTDAVRHATIWAPDGYCHMSNSAGTSYTTPTTRFGAFLSWCDAHDIPLRGVSENALNNDVGAPPSACAAWLNNELMPWLIQERPHIFVYYQSPGPAAGGKTPDIVTAEQNGTSPYLDSTGELLAFGAACLQFNYE